MGFKPVSQKTIEISEHQVTKSGTTKDAYSIFCHLIFTFNRLGCDGAFDRSCEQGARFQMSRGGEKQPRVYAKDDSFWAGRDKCIIMYYITVTKLMVLIVQKSC